MRGLCNIYSPRKEQRNRSLCKNKYNLVVVRDSETQTKRKGRGIVFASLLRSIINDQVEAISEAGI